MLLHASQGELTALDAAHRQRAFEWRDDHLYSRRSYHDRLKALRLFTLSCASLLMAPDPGGTARKALDLFLGAKYAELNQMFALSGKDSYSESALAKLGAMAKAYCDMQKIGEPSVRDMGLVSVVTIPVQFAKQNIDFTVPSTPAVDCHSCICDRAKRFGRIPITSNRAPSRHAR
jgi:hypothetical protein